MLIWRTLSVAGMLLLIGAYIFNQRGVWRPEQRVYLAANAIGALLLTVYSWKIGEWVFVALEGFWSAVSFRLWFKAPPKP